MTKLKNINSIVIVCMVLFIIALGCGGGKPVPQNYQGNWVGNDGSTISMTADGKAGFKIGSKSVDGGSAEIDESAKTLTISLFGISHTWKIDSPPDGSGEMTLSGTVYTKR